MWLYQNKVLTEENIPVGAIGFIYLITNLKDGKKYIGKKLLTMAATKQVNGRKKKTRKQSNWVNYWSSCDELKADVKLLGEDNFTREVLVFTFTLSTHTYLENKYLYVNEVLESNQWYNSNISAKIYKKNIIGKI